MWIGRRAQPLPTSVVVATAVAAAGKAASPATVKAAPAASIPEAVAEPAVALQPTVTEVETIHGEDAARAERSRVWLVWISAAALLITLTVGVLTVRSLMRQIDRLLTGIRRVARGEAAAVSMGGLHEIDVVAAEFNAMSSQLAAARAENLSYQDDLEARVEQRTSQLHYQAAHDPLTSLPNRRELNRLLSQALATAERNGRRVGVFLVDLDNFKVVNDGMGHGFGDQVLIAVAERLQSLVPAGGFAARLGGDEFTMVAADAQDIDSIRAAGWALVRAFQQPLSIGGRELLLSVSVGASIYPDHEGDAEALLRAADSALFRAKALGRSQLALFTPEMFDAAEARFSTEQSLRRAVERGEFELVYQPEVDSRSFEVRSVEALLRWRLPDGRYASPGEFLAVAEESGLIAEISDWVLGEAVAAAGRWYRGGWSDVRVAINVSSRQLVDLGFVPRLAALLAKEGLPPTAVEIELTENVLQTGAHTIKTLHDLRALGVSTALDDFGTGYSSLASLEQLPLTRVKLDRSLIEAMDTSPRAAAIGRSIINLCEGLGLEVTAEGIERLAQFDLLMRHQPLMLQGFLLARPMAEAKIHAVRTSMQSHLTSLLLSAQEEGTLQTARPPLTEVAEERRTGYL
jgi:diguanylate cyclase (GGDEF)-like protein